MKRLKSTDRELTLIRALLHGDSGIGKTTSILTCPEDKTLVAISERGSLPLRKRNYDCAFLENWQDCRDLIKVVIEEAARENGKRILVIDSLTECSEFCKSQIVNVDRKALMKDRSGGKSDKPTGIYDDLMAMEDWNLYSSRMNGFLAAVCRLPMHVIVTALSLRKENKKTGEQIVSPDINGALAFECPAYFDVVMHMESAQQPGEDGPTSVRLWRTFNDGSVLAKDSSAALAPLEAANWTKVFGKILGTKEKKGEVKK